MLFSPLTYIGLEGALHKSLLEIIFLPIKGHNGMGGKGRGLGQDGSNRQIPTPLGWAIDWGLIVLRVLVWITTCFPGRLPLPSPSIHRYSPLWLENEV
jgi:hypothetical protein